MYFMWYLVYEGGGYVLIIVCGEGVKIYDVVGKEYIDGFVGLFIV